MSVLEPILCKLNKNDTYFLDTSIMLPIIYYDSKLVRALKIINNLSGDIYFIKKRLEKEEKSIKTDKEEKIKTLEKLYSDSCERYNNVKKQINEYSYDLERLIKEHNTFIIKNVEDEFNVGMSNLKNFKYKNDVDIDYHDILFRNINRYGKIFDLMKYIKKAKNKRYWDILNYINNITNGNSKWSKTDINLVTSSLLFSIHENKNTGIICRDQDIRSILTYIYAPRRVLEKNISDIISSANIGIFYPDKNGCRYFTSEDLKAQSIGTNAI